MGMSKPPYPEIERLCNVIFQTLSEAEDAIYQDHPEQLPSHIRTAQEAALQIRELAERYGQ